MKRLLIKRKALIAIIVAVFVAVIVLLASAWADDGRVMAWVICHPASYVNARYSPSAKSESIGRFDAGDKVEIDGKFRNGFAHSDAMGFEYGEGWVSAGYLVFDEPEWKNGDWYIICSNGRVAARKCIDGERLCWLKNGTELQVFWMSDEWSVTTRGMVKTEYLEEDPR